jgi:hypothetical protein
MLPDNISRPTLNDVTTPCTYNTREDVTTDQKIQQNKDVVITNNTTFIQNSIKIGQFVHSHA